MSNKAHFKGEFSGDYLEGLKKKIGSSDENCFYDVRAKRGEKVETIIDRTDDVNKLDEIDLDDTVECYILNWYYGNGKNPKERHFLYTYPDAMTNGLGSLSPADAVQKQVTEQMEAFKKDFKISELTKQVNELEKKITEERKQSDKAIEALQQEIDELSKEIEKYQEAEGDEAKMQRMTTLAATALAGFTRINPALGQKIEKGLSGLLGLPPVVEQPATDYQQETSQALSDEDIHALRTGRSLIKTFPEPYMTTLWNLVLVPLSNDLNKIKLVSELLKENENEQNTTNY